MKRPIHVLASILLAAAGAALSVAIAQPPPPPQPKPTMVKPGKIHEKCMVLDAGQKLEYRFTSSAKLNFNLHYAKGGDQTYYPVKLDRTTGESGLYEARSREKYCVSWENRTDADVELSYSTKVGR